MDQNSQVNPLKQYFRSFSFYIKVPSGTAYYPEGTVEFNDMGEIGIMPMTGRDELFLKNPDALLNGEALLEIMKSCVPSIKNPKVLLTNDIDAIITAVRYATFQDHLETDINCPKCGAENTFRTDLQYALDNMSFLESDYIVYLDSGLSVFIRPFTFTDMLRSLHAQFERSKIVKSIDDKMQSKEERAAMFNAAFKELATTKFDLLASVIARIVDEKNNVNVSDKKHIKDFLQNIDKKSVDKINDMLDEINAVGIKRTFTAECQTCQHQWESEIDFNPVNFS
jgi:hypothetical protein